jgi:hypothetical protein
VLCLQCRFGNRASVSFGEECGARLEVACPSCGAAVPPGRKFCETCGHALTARAEPAPMFVRAAMRLNLMEPTPGLSSGGARSEIRTLPVRGPHVPPPTIRAVNGQARKAWAFPRSYLAAQSGRFLMSVRAVRTSVLVSALALSRSTKRVLGLLAVPVAILWAVFATPVHANDLFYTTSLPGPNLIAIHVQNVNKTTTTLIGPMGGGSCASLALAPWGTLYSVCGDLFGVQKLATIDRGDGHATLFGMGVSGMAVMSLEFGPDGTLYAVGNCNLGPTECTPGSPNYNSLYKVNVGTGKFTRVGPNWRPVLFHGFGD